MNSFEIKLKESSLYPLKAKKINSIIAGMGFKCNLRCTHCYLEASPEKSEVMSLETINKILDILKVNPEITTVDITGGSAELHPHFRYFVKSVSDLGRQALVPSNLTVYAEPGMGDVLEFLAENRVSILASLPCVTEETVDKQRGKGTYKKAIDALQKLNAIGYGKDGSGLELNIIFNPSGAYLSPDPEKLEKAYKDKLMELYGITFNKLFRLNNVPLGRMRKSMSDDEVDTYMKELENSFNPDNVEDLMCRSSVSVDGYSGRLYDCDFARVLKLEIKSQSSSVDNFDYEMLSSREISTSPICFSCTAGSGQECCAAKLT